MLEWWSSVFFYIVLLIAAIALWSRRHFRLNRQVVISVVFALVAFFVLFFLQGEAKFPNASAPIANKVWGTIAIILAFYSVLQALEWTMIEFLDHRYKLKLPRFLINFLRWLVLIILSLALIRELFGLELTGLVITSTVATAIIGLSLQEIMSNLFAGITLQIESPFTIGDWITVKGIEGKIARQSWRSLSILTRMGNYVIFTNNSISKEKIINYDRPTALQGQELFISVSHDYSPTRVKKVLLNTIMGVEAVQKTPATKAYLVEYGLFRNSREDLRSPV
jgi:small-conductance mechanosensitive channel